MPLAPLTRAVHPGAWWLWALGAAIVATRTTNWLILLLLAGAVIIVVLTCRGDTPNASYFRMYAWLAVFLVVMRVLFRVVFQGGGTTVLLALPTLTLPRVLTGAHILGPVTAEALLGGMVTGGQLGMLVLCVGAANSLASPRRLLATLPAALYELGMTVVVAVSVFPQLADSVTRVSRSRLLRDDRGTWRHMIREVITPVLADTLDRSLLLAGAMDSRGYGRAVAVTRRQSTATTAVLALAMASLSIGAFAVLGPWNPVVGWLVVGGGAALACLGFRLAGRRTRRTRYRLDPWGAPEWVLAAAAALAVAVTTWLGVAYPAVLSPGVPLFAWPVALLPATLLVPVLVATEWGRR